MNKKRTLQIEAWGYAVSLAVCIVVAVQKMWRSASLPDDWWVGPALAILMGVMAWIKFRQARRTPLGQQDHGLPITATNSEKISYYRQLMWYTGIAIVAMTLFTAWQLNNINTSSPATGSLWDVAALLYWIGGRKAALWGLPALGIIIILLLHKKVNTLKQLSN